MSLNANGYKLLEGICRNFLWGKNKVGEQKWSLIAWKNMARRRAEGGLGIEPFAEQSLALKLWWCTRFLEEQEVMWVQFAEISIKRCLVAGPGCHTKKH